MFNNSPQITNRKHEKGFKQDEGKRENKYSTMIEIKIQYMVTCFNNIT
jgi:hypothetical protein